MVRLAIRELRANALRSSLTALGIVAGVAGIIALSAIIQGVAIQVQGDIASVGRNVLIVAPVAPNGVGVEPAQPFALSDADAIAREVRAATAVAPVATGTMTAASDGRRGSVDVVGTTPAFFNIRMWPIAEGRSFSAEEARAARPVCVIGASVRELLFETRRAIGAMIRIGSVACEVVGALLFKGHSVIGLDQDNVVVMPFRTLARRFGGTLAVEEIWIKVSNARLIDGVTTATRRLLRERRGDAAGTRESFRIQDVREVARLVDSISGSLTLGAAAIAAISLVAGGIGIMNIMLVTVAERGREIGIRLALGAREGEIALQFLIEAVALGGAGGVVGAVLGVLLAALAGAAIGIPFAVSPWAVAGAFLFAAVVGAVFGLGPALRAARLDPIDALRRE